MSQWNPTAVGYTVGMSNDQGHEPHNNIQREDTVVITLRGNDFFVQPAAHYPIDIVHEPGCVRLRMSTVERTKMTKQSLARKVKAELKLVESGVTHRELAFCQHCIASPVVARHEAERQDAAKKAKHRGKHVEDNLAVADRVFGEDGTTPAVKARRKSEQVQANIDAVLEEV